MRMREPDDRRLDLPAVSPQRPKVAAAGGGAVLVVTWAPPRSAPLYRLHAWKNA
jgi:hypothetical protein